MDEPTRKGVLAVLTVPQVAKILGIGRNQAYEAARRGDIPAIKIGKRILVPELALQHMLESAGNVGHPSSPA